MLSCTPIIKVFFWLAIVILALSIFLFITETNFHFRIPRETAMNQSLTRYQRYTSTVPVPWITRLSFYCNVFFILEFLLRFLSCPSKKKFLQNPYTYIEFLACTPFFVPTNTVESSLTIMGRVYHYMHIFYVLRIFRIFVMVPTDNGLKVLLFTLKNSINELMIYFLMLIMAILIFAR